MRVYHSSTLADGFSDLVEVVFVEQVRHNKDFIGNYAFSHRSAFDKIESINTVAVFIVKPKQSKS